MNEKTEKLSGTELQRQIDVAVRFAMQGFRREIKLQRGKTMAAGAASASARGRDLGCTFERKG